MLRLNLKSLHLPVFIPSILIIFAISLICIVYPQKSNDILTQLKEIISVNFGWFYILTASLFIIFLLLISGSRLGDIKLGDNEDKPEYSFTSWFSMLFASGMGIGLMYFGVAEPISHYIHPVYESTSEVIRTKNALLLSFYHWGIHAWAIYAVMGLALAYFGFRYKLPLTIRSGFFPILKEHSNKLCGDLIDIFALFSTVFGICTSLGFGALQLNAGFIYLGITSENSALIQTFIILAIMCIVAISTIIGVAKGMKIISQINLLLAFVLLVCIAILGPTLFLASSFTENIGFYIKNLIELSFKTFAYENNKQSWFSSWTILYWAWWMSWAPFVGLFIAKISKGRTVREFILGVLFIPSLFNFIWMTVFGNSAIWIDKNNSNVLSERISDISSLLFYFLEKFPLGIFLSVIAVIVIALFFITSADSGINVINSISSKGKNEVSISQSLLWTLIIIVLSCSLLYSGGLQALQTMNLIITLPVCLIMLILCIGVWKGMLADNQYFNKKFTHSSAYWKDKNWRDKLNKIIVSFTQKDVTHFIINIAKPAFHILALELKSYALSVKVNSDNINYIEIIVLQEHKQSFIYGIRSELDKENYLPISYFSDGRKGYDVKFMNQNELITDVLKQYELYLSLVNDSQHHLRTEELN